MGVKQHGYKHLDKDKHCNVNIELNMSQLAEMVCKANYGLHRFLSEVVDIKQRSEYKEERKFAEKLKYLLEDEEACDVG